MMHYMCIEITLQMHVQIYVCPRMDLQLNVCKYVCMHECLCVFVFVSLYHCARQAGCVTRWQSKALYVCVCVCVEQVCLAAPHSLLPICAPVCVPPAPTLCQQHHTMARRPRREGC